MLRIGVTRRINKYCSVFDDQNSKSELARKYSNQMLHLFVDISKSTIPVTWLNYLYCCEIRYKSLNVIITNPEYESLFYVCQYEKTIVTVNLGFDHSPVPSYIVKMDNQRQLLISVGDYMSQVSLSSSWPQYMSNFSITEENDARALMISDNSFRQPRLHICLPPRGLHHQGHGGGTQEERGFGKLGEGRNLPDRFLDQ